MSIRWIAVLLAGMVTGPIQAAQLAVDHPCVPAPIFPADCVAQLGPIGEPVSIGVDEGYRDLATPVVDPLLLLSSSNASDGYLYALNPASNQVRVLDPGAGMAVVADIPTCYRPSALAQSTDGSEVLVACHASHAIAVIDTALQRVVAEIQDRDALGRPLLQEPMGMAVVGNTVYVASSQNNRIAVVDRAARSVLRYLPIPGQDPRALAVSPSGAHLVVANFLAGNRTEPLMGFNGQILNPATPSGAVCAPLLADPGALAVVDESSPAFMDTTHPDFAVLAECYLFAHTFGGTGTIVLNPERPDHDLVVVDLASETVVFTTDSLAADIGTLNYDLAFHPAGDRLYVATVHARNDLNFDFGNRPLVNRLAILNFDPATGAMTVQSIQDLDDPFLDENGEGAAVAATPYALAVDGSGVHLAAAGSDHLVEMDYLGNVTDTIPVGFAPKGVVTAGTLAYVYNAAGHTVSRVNLSAAKEQATASLGASATSQPVRIGGRLFQSAAFASNGTFACASCHPDAHLDGLVWQLNDVDGLRSSMTIQEIKETAAYHWDGSKCNLMKILQDGIVNLFSNPAGPSSCEIETMSDFMNKQVRPHSVFRPLDDSMTDEAKLGLGIMHRGHFKDLADNLIQCTNRAQDPAIETEYLAAIGDPGNQTFNYNGGGGPFPNTLVSETCGSANCHVSPHWESDGFRNGDPNQGLIDGFQAVSSLGGWDRMVTQHDARTTRVKFLEALKTNRAFHGAAPIQPQESFTGVEATHGFNDTHFRHPEFNHDGNPATHGFVLSDALTRFGLEEEELQTGAVGLTVVLDQGNASDTERNRLLAFLEDAADQGKAVLLGTGVLAGAPISMTWQPGTGSFLTGDGDTLTWTELKNALTPGDALLFRGGLLPGQGDTPSPKLKAVSRATSPILCSEGYGVYHASVETGEVGVSLTIQGMGLVAGSRVLLEGEATGAPLSGPGPDFSWTLPAAPATPGLLTVQILGPDGMQSNSIPLPVVSPVAAAVEPENLDVSEASLVSWEDQFGITGPGTRYDVYRGSIADLHGPGGFQAGECLTPTPIVAAQQLAAENPGADEVFYYVARAQNQVNVTTWGSALRDAGIGASPSSCSVLFP